MREAGFYWAKRKDDGVLTVIELVTRQGSPYWQLMGTLSIPDEAEIDEWLDVMDRIAAPPSRVDAIIKCLAEMDEPLCDSLFGDSICGLCSAVRPYDEHDADCPWANAQKLSPAK
ncbi:hypothetical protein [Bradyrhizobium prioriisuperbiae]|uniref:hypothetical protein n=1 Tax=Bradyrhizobium prioriisuperbiae TaxID=2854389 RepID=UPI0028EE9416|nr:hypothetical protein [Bradyrhizobium prioritasuperba]